MPGSFNEYGIRQEAPTIDPAAVQWDAPQASINPAAVKWDDAPASAGDIDLSAVKWDDAPAPGRIDPSAVQWDDAGPPRASFEGVSHGVNSTSMTPAQANNEVPLPDGWTGQRPAATQSPSTYASTDHSNRLDDAISNSAPVTAMVNSELAKGFIERLHQTSAAAATIESAPAVLFDSVKSAVTGTPSTEATDAAFRTFVDPNKKAAEANAVDQKAGFGGKLAHGLGGLSFDLPAMVATGGEEVAVPLVERGTTALRSGIDALTGAFEHSAKSTLVPGTTNAVDTAQDVLNKGGSGAQASTAAIGSFAADTLGNALPLGAAGGVTKRAASGAVAGVAGGKVSQQVRNATRPADMQQQSDGSDDVMSAVQGGALAAIMGRSAPHDALAGKPLERGTENPAPEQKQPVAESAPTGPTEQQAPSPQRDQITALAKQHLAELNAKRGRTPAENGMRDFLREHQDNPDVLAEGLGIELEKAPDAEAPIKAEAPALTGNATTDNLAAKLSDHESASTEYAAIPETKGGTVLGTDIARELSPEYMADRTKSADTHEPASAFIKKLYAEKLSQPTPEGKDNLVLFTAGGTGAGKTTGLRLLGDAVKPEIIYDTNMNTLDSSKAKIEQALAGGRDVSILYTYRDPAEALRRGALDRASRQEREFGSGRTVPVGEHARTHTGSFDVVNQLAKEYAGDGRVTIVAVDNSHGKNNEKRVRLEDIPNPHTEDLHDRLHQQLDEAHANGEISDAIHAGFKAQSSREIGNPRERVRQEPERGSDEGAPGGHGDPAGVDSVNENGSGVAESSGPYHSENGAGSESGEVAAPEPEQTHQTAGPTVHLPVSRLKLSDDVPQFKSGAGDNGVVEPLGGTFDERGEPSAPTDDTTAPMFSRANKGEEDGTRNEGSEAGQDRGNERGTDGVGSDRGTDRGSEDLGKLEGVRGAVTPHTVESLRAELHDTSLAGPLAALERSGALRIVHDPNNKSGGWWNGKTATLNAAHIPRSEALGVALHELGVHRESDQRAGLRHLVGEAEFNSISKRLDELAKGNDSAADLVRAADARIDNADTPPHQRAEERLAYVVEEGANRMRDGTLKGQARALMERIWARLRVSFMRSRLYAAAEKRGIAFKLTPDDMVALAKAAVRRQARDIKTDVGRDETLHSRPRTPIIAKDDITAGLTALATHDEAFKLKASSKSSLPDILRDNEKGYSIVHSADLADDSGAGAENAWAIRTPDGKEARVYKKGREVWVDVSDLKQGDEGQRIYNTVANWAHNDKLVFIGDPAGLSHIAMKRRTENMLSSALKFSSTDHLHPHERQLRGDKGLNVGPLRWKVGDTANNIREMARVTADTTAHEFPEVKDLVYNGESQRFERRDGTEVTDHDFDDISERGRERYASKLEPSSGGRIAELRPDNAARVKIALTAGRTSLKRAVFVRSLVHGEGGEIAFGARGVLAGHGEGMAQQIAGASLPVALHKTLYSKPRKGADERTTAKDAEREKATMRLPKDALSEQSTDDKPHEPAEPAPLNNIGDAHKAAAALRAIGDPKHIRELTRGDIRSALARRDRRVAQADASVNAFIKYFDKRPKEVREDPRQALADVIRFQRGEPTLDPLTRPFFASVRHLLDSQAAEIRSFGTKYLEHLVENYFPQQWEEPERTHAFYTDAMAKRPLAGGKKFTKERVFNDYEEGIAAGFKPISTNPADLLMGRYQAGEKLLASLRIMKALEDRGVVHDLEKGERIPMGFARVNDNAFTSKVIPEMSAHDLNNYLDPGLTKFAAWRSFRYLQNLLLSARLGLSAFHAGMTTLDTIATHADIGWRRIALLHDVKGGLRELAKIPVAVYTSPKGGNKLMRQFEGKEAADPNTAAILDALAEGGARGKMNPVDYNDDYRKLMRAIDQGDARTIAMKAIPGAIEGTTRLIAHSLVPAQKMTARVMHMKFRLDQVSDELGTGRGNYKDTLDALHPDTLKQISYEINATIDDRLGQFAYDNLFWNKTMKDALHASVQSVGWNWGSLRLIVGGISDVRRLSKPEGYVAPLDKAGKIADAKQSRLTDRLSYLITLNAVVAMMGATTQYLMTGHGPKDAKDFFFPRTGRKNDDDTEERIAFPSYVKDEFSWLFHPLTTASHKLHPSLSMLSEIARNKDFYGTEVYDPDASIPTEAKQFLAYLGKSMMPYAIQGAAKNASTGTSAVMTALPFIGITPASGEVTKSKFQEYVADKYYDTLPSGARSQEKTDISANFKAAVKAARDGEQPDTRGFSPSQLKRLATEKQELVPQIRFKRLSINQQLNAWEKATPDERESYKLRAAIMHGGYAKIGREPEADQARLREQMKSVMASGAAAGD